MEQSPTTVPSEIIEMDAIVSRAKSVAAEAIDLFEKHKDSSLAPLLMERVVLISSAVSRLISEHLENATDPRARILLAIAAGTLCDKKAVPELLAIAEKNPEGWGPLAAHKLSWLQVDPIDISNAVENQLAKIDPAKSDEVLSYLTALLKVDNRLSRANAARIRGISKQVDDAIQQFEIVD